jgi:alpha-beta hydrolase superfamily lysophospholipase
MKRELFETVCDGITLRGELCLPGEGFPATVAPLCHGIPREGPRPGDLGYFPIAERLVGLGYGALVFNFRGCGVSGGDFDIMGWGRDLLAVVAKIRAMRNVRKIVPWGFSGGAAATVWAAAHDKEIQAAALFACPADFTTLKAIPVRNATVEYFRRVGIIRDSAFPSDVDKWLGNFDLIDPLKHISLIAPRPVLIVHGDSDETVPVEHAHRLMSAAKEPKTLRIIPGALHRLRENLLAIEEAIEWMKKLA